MDTTYTVKIATPGQMVIHKTRIFRTPVTFEKVLENDLAFLKVQCHQKYLLIDISKTEEKVKEEVIEEIDLTKEDEDIEVEELEKKQSTTILEKLLSEE